MKATTKAERCNFVVTGQVRADMQTVRDYLERTTRRAFEVTKTDVVHAALRLAAEYITGQPLESRSK